MTVLARCGARPVVQRHVRLDPSTPPSSPRSSCNPPLVRPRRAPVDNSCVSFSHQLDHAAGRRRCIGSHSKGGPCSARRGSHEASRALLAEPEEQVAVKEESSRKQSSSPPPLPRVSTSDHTAYQAVEGASRKKLHMGHSDTPLDSTLIHWLWLGAGVGAIGGMLLKSGLALRGGDGTALQVGAAMLAAYVLADLGTGVYHWGVDNYGDAGTPVFGPQIDAFQGHHRRPWTIAKRAFANNLHALARPASFALLPFLLLPSSATWDAFLGVFLACVVFSQQFHAWAHTPKLQLPPAVVALQDAGVLVSRRAHGRHHRPPFRGNYCIVSGLCNEPLDRSGLLDWMERQILERWGVAPRGWGETPPEWLARGGAYFEDGTGPDVDE